MAGGVTDQQPSLFKPPAPVAVIGKLTTRQMQAWDYIRSVPGGVTADEIGALLHSLREDRWAHSTDARCDYCATTGREVATSAGLKPLVVRRRGGKYEPRRVEDRAVVEAVAAPITELRGDSWEDMFGDAA